MEAYFDDLLVKSKKCKRLVENLIEILKILKESQMRNNPKKCIYGVSSKKNLEFLVSKNGIEANLDKVHVI